PRRRREVGGSGVAGHVRIPRAIYGDAVANLPAPVAAPEVGGEDEPRAVCSQFGHKHVASFGRLESPWRRRKVGGGGIPRHVSVAGAVYGDAMANVTRNAATPEVGGVDERGTVGIEFRHKGRAVRVASICGLERS